MYGSRGGLWAGFLLSLCFLLGPALAQSGEFPSTEIPSAVTTPAADDSTSALVKRILPSLVNLRVVEREYYSGRECLTKCQGSGVIVSPTGYVLTNDHVARNAQSIVAEDYTGREFHATVLACDPVLDLALLKLDVVKPVPYLEFADSDIIREGDTVLALGNPLTYGSSVSRGVVSNARRVFTSSDKKELETRINSRPFNGLLSHWIQHDALIRPGNSGRPLVDMQGRVVGINQLLSSGIGFAIPSNTAREFYQSVARGGRPNSRGWLGCTFQPGPEDGPHCATVSEVYPGSAADVAGFESGDLLTELDGKPVAVSAASDVPQLYQAVCNLPIGGRVKAKALRDGKPMTLDLTVEDLGRWSTEDVRWDALGVTLRSLTPAEAKRRGIEHGVLVTGVEVGGPWDLAVPAIDAGVVVVGVDGRPVQSVEQLQGLVDLARPFSLDCGSLDYRWTAAIDPQRHYEMKQPLKLEKATSGIWGLSMSLEQASVEKREHLAGAVYVGRVATPEAKAVLHVGDLIVEVDGRSLLGLSKVRSQVLWSEAVDRHQVGETLKLKVVDEQNQERAVDLVMAREPGSGFGSSAWLDRLGLVLTEKSSTEKNAVGEKVLQISSCLTGSPARLAGLQSGDVVERIDHQRVLSPPVAAQKLGHTGCHELVVNRDGLRLSLKLEVCK